MKPRQFYNLVSIGWLALVWLMVSPLLALMNHNPISSVLLGLGWSVDSFGILLSLLQVLVPRQLIRWHASLVASDPDHWTRTLAPITSGLMHVDSEDSWSDPVAVRRIRLWGVAGLLLFSLVGAGLVWILGPLDAFFSFRRLSA
jgi:hypothetical protein